MLCARASARLHTQAVPHRPYPNTLSDEVWIAKDVDPKVRLETLGHERTLGDGPPRFENEPQFVIPIYVHI